MKCYAVILLALSVSCNDIATKQPAGTANNSVIKKIRDTVYLTSGNKEWQSGFGLTHDTNVDSIWFKPVSYYFKDPLCSGLAKDFYYGYLRPSDDGTTEELLKLATTDSDKLRPLYRWCLDKTILVQDGALAEMTGLPARRYVEKFPMEFIEFTRDNKISNNGSKRWNWSEAIHFSGYYENESTENSGLIYDRFLKEAKRNCRKCTEGELEQIALFGRMAF